jgi:DNA-binding transcriptional MerR regulator
MNNKDENLFSIGEVCRILGITRRILLNYETLGLIEPDKKKWIKRKSFLYS